MINRKLTQHKENNKKKEYKLPIVRGFSVCQINEQNAMPVAQINRENHSGKKQTSQSSYLKRSRKTIDSPIFYSFNDYPQHKCFKIPCVKSNRNNQHIYKPSDAIAEISSITNEKMVKFERKREKSHEERDFLKRVLNDDDFENGCNKNTKAPISNSKETKLYNEIFASNLKKRLWKIRGSLLSRHFVTGL